jgi:hypothetical protein
MATTTSATAANTAAVKAVVVAQVPAHARISEAIFAAHINRMLLTLDSEAVAADEWAKERAVNTTLVKH